MLNKCIKSLKEKYYETINGIHDVDWTKQLVWEINRDDVRINTIVQQYPIHYHIKEFANKIEPIYDKLLESN